jgi:F-type H+-transporting ATPase subunit b
VLAFFGEHISSTQKTKDSFMNINVSLFAQCIVFLVLTWFTMKFVWPPLIKSIDERNKKIADGLAAAERGQEDLRLAEEKAAAELTEARKQAAEIIRLAETRANQVVEEAKHTAEVQSARIITNANLQLEQEISKAKQALREDLSSIVISATEKLLQKEINASIHADFLNQLKTEL